MTTYDIFMMGVMASNALALRFAERWGNSDTIQYHGEYDSKGNLHILTEYQIIDPTDIVLDKRRPCYNCGNPWGECINPRSCPRS